MIIWKGWGFLVVVITFLIVLAAELISEDLTHNESYYQEHSLLALALLIAGIVNGALGKWLNSRKTKTVINNYSRKEIVVPNNHALLFIPMEYWGIILIVAAVIVLAVK